MYEVEADAGRLEPNDSPRGESIFVTWSPKIYHEARDGAPSKALKAPAGNEKTIIENELSRPIKTVAKPLPMQKTIKRLSKSLDTNPKRTFKVSTEDVYALLITLQGKNVDQENIDRVRNAFPMLWDDVSD